ncbi:MAG: hypothetical protein GXY83_05820, partial [Rhodopirellula sp.]|nr:hypothetical protein [Rhodopirellula sp.]
MRTRNRRRRAIRRVRYGAIASGWLPLGRPLVIEPLESRLLLSAEWPLEFGIPHDIPDALIVGPGEILSGNRAILGDVVNRGVLSPGNSPGVISINGNLTIATSDGDTIDDGYTPPPASDTVGTIRMEIGGTDPDAPDYDQIHVTGIATLGGTLEVVLINDFVPEPGQTFDILTAAEINGEFDSAPGLWVQFDVEEATVGYLDINVVDNPSGGKILQLELVEFPGGLRYEPESDDQKDELGEFLNDIGTDTQTFTFAGSISVPGFADLSGEFTLEKAADGSKLLIGAADINTFLGTGLETPDTTDDVGLEVRGANLGVLVLTPPGVPSSFALTASGSVALAGLDGLSISGAVAVEVNKTGQTVDEVVSGVPVRFDTPAQVQVIRGIVAMEVDGAFALGGELIATKTRGGAVLVDIPELVLTVKPHDEELFTIGGGARFSIGGSDGFRLLDMGLNSVTAFGATFDVGGVLPRFGSSESGGSGGAADEFAIELTSLPGLSVDASVLNRRKYIDVTYFAPQGTVWDDSLIDVSDFTLGGTGVADAEVDHVEWLAGDTFRYYLRDKDADNEVDLFVAGNGDEPNVELAFEAGSWANGSPKQTFAIAIRDGGATGAGEMSANPLTIKGPHIGIEDFQYKGGGHLAITLGIGAGEALLDFGNKAQQASSGISVQLTDVLGTFEVGADYVAGSWDNLTGAFGFQVEQLEATVPDVLGVTAAGIQVSYDPQDDTVGKEIITVDSASIEVPKVGATGFIGPYTRQDGTTIPGLRVRNNGFNLGAAGLTTDVAVDLEGILELTGVGVGVADFGVTFGQEVDFNGEIFIAAGGAKLFPGKTLSATIQDGTDADNEAVRCELTFTDGRVDGFEFQADQFELKFGSYLTVTGSDILIDTGAGPTDEAVSLASLGAHLKAGPLDLAGEMRNFAFLGNGSFDTKPGFGVSFNRDRADSKAFKWPSWLPIRITSVGAKWRNISADPADFQITVSAAVTGLYNLPVKVSGAIEGLVIDVGLLMDGKFPITRLESMTVGVEGKLFGGEVKGSLLGGILAFDNQGNVLDGDKPGVADRVFFVGLEGGFEMPGVGGMSIRLALSELGPLGVLITAATPTGILLEPVSGLTINDFVAGVEFFKTLPSITETDDLRDPEFAVSTDIDPADWLDSVQAQVVAQYRQIQNHPNQAGFLAAFTEPMLITAGCTLYSQYASRYTFSGDVQMKISTDGKFMAAGTLNFFNSALSTTARLYADLSQVASGNATILFLADVPDQLKLMVIQGKFRMEFLDDMGEPFEVVPGQAHDTSLLPVANLASPGAGGEIGLQTLKGRGYLDVAYVAKGGAEIDPSSILDGGAEFRLRLPGGTLLDLTGVPTQPEGFAAANKFRYALPQAVNLVPGEYTVEFLPGSFDSVFDGTRRTNAADTETFQVTEPAAQLAGPKNGGQIDQRALNQSGHITVRFQPVTGSELDPGSILDLAAEFTLAGPGAGTSQLGQPTVAAEDANTYIYPVTGQFGLGLVEVQFLPDGFRDKAGNRSGIVPVETFTVTGATADLLVRSQDVQKLNDTGYFDVRFSPTYLAAIDAGSILDPAAEFTLSGHGKGTAAINDGQTEHLDAQTFRYYFSGNFTPGEVTVAFTEGSFQDTAGTANLGEEETLVVQGPAVELLAPQARMAGVALSSVDLKFRPTWGNTLDENIVPQFILSGSAVPQGVTVGNPTSLGDGVYRYTFSGSLQPGEIKLAFAAGAVQDSAGYASLAHTEVLTIVELTAGLAYPLAGSRVSLEQVNQEGYLDVTFADPLGVGLNVDSITDQGAEITLWTKDDQGQEIPIHGVHVVGKPEQLSGNTYRYGFSGMLPAGPVIVKYAAGSWTDTAGNPGSAGEQAFLATRTAATLSIDVGGSIELFAGSADRRLLGISGGVSVRAEMGGLGTRVTVDMHGQIDLVYLGTVGASAGRFVFEDPDQGKAGMWGALRIDTNFKKLESLGIVLDAYCLLEVNTTNVERSETLTLAGQAKDGGDLTRTFELGPEMFRIEAAGIAALHVPPLLNGGKLGRELAHVDGALLLDVSREGIEAFAAGEIRLGPSGVGFHAEAQGVLIVNDDGFAADVAVTQSFELGPVLDFESKAHVTLNVTGKEQSVELPEEMLDYLPDEALDSLGGPNGRSYAVPAGPPQQNGQIGAAGVYVVVRAEGELTVGGGFGMQGDFWMEVSQEQFFLDASASLSLGLIGSLSAGGVFIADASGTRAWCAVDGQLGSDQLGLKLADAHGVFEVNTTGSDWSFDRDGRSILVPRGSFGVAVDASFDFPGFADGGGTASVTYVDNKLRFYLDGELHLGNRLNVDVDAYVGVYDTGVVVNAKVALDLNLLGILDVNVDGRLQINTTAGNVSRYEAPVTSGGNILYKEVSCVDANGDPTSIRAHSFFLDVKGDMRLLGAFTLSGQVTIDVDDHAWTIDIPDVSANVFGVMKIDAAGWVKSTGEFDLDFAGLTNLTWLGNGYRGDLNIHTTLDVDADPDFTFLASGSGSAKIAGVTVAGAIIGLKASGDLGESIPITLSAEGRGKVFQVISGVKSFFHWIVSGKWVTKQLGFSVPVGTIQLPAQLVTEQETPPPLLAGASDGSAWDNDEPPADGILFLN